MKPCKKAEAWAMTVRRVWRRVLRVVRWAALIGVVLLTVRGSVFPSQTVWGQLMLATSGQQFDFVRWEAEALWAKTTHALWGLHPFMTEAERSAFVRAYFEDVGRVQRLEAEVERVYSDPATTDPDTASAPLRTERDRLRSDLRHRQSLTEAIVEGQVAAVLIAEGFGVFGQLIPPMAMRLTPQPDLVIVSPRDAIRFDYGINLYAQTTDQRAALEARLAAQLDVSALVVPIGGIALYPAMVVETPNLAWTIETFAHEWLHHYFFQYPLGWALDFADPAWHINETAASLFGVEVGQKVLARYYPDLARAPHTAQRIAQTDAPPPFDFGAAMHETRTTVDALLAAGEVEQAEAYMEERRRLFFAEGYLIRRLNQAYFAFYGGYQVEGIPGIAGTDPTGPAVRAIREASPDLHTFAVMLRGITTREALLAMRDSLGG
ncbi:MAG: hypothetical protein MUC99_03310 [Anaerolineae bacterium]|nr:hypothetical protein [Anaerolineae bacterium]